MANFILNTKVGSDLMEDAHLYVEFAPNVARPSYPAIVKTSSKTQTMRLTSLLNRRTTKMETRVKVYPLHSSGNALCVIHRKDGTIREIFVLWKKGSMPCVML